MSASNIYTSRRHYHPWPRVLLLSALLSACSSTPPSAPSFGGRWQPVHTPDPHHPAGHQAGLTTLP